LTFQQLKFQPWTFSLHVAPNGSYWKVVALEILRNFAIGTPGCHISGNELQGLYHHSGVPRRARQVYRGTLWAVTFDPEGRFHFSQWFNKSTKAPKFWNPHDALFKPAHKI